MTKVMTLLGTRPEIIRLSRVIAVLDETCDHMLVDTGQNYDDRLSGMFYRELGVREPDVTFGVRGASFADQIGQIITKAEELFRAEKPDTVLILGDTNTGIAAFVAKRMGIRVCHMEAGNRCFDDRVPEEVNRRVIDHSSSVLLPYTLPLRREPRARRHRPAAHLRDRQPHQGSPRLLRGSRCWQQTRSRSSASSPTSTS